MFTNITLADKDRFYTHWQATPQRSIDYSLVNLWGWERCFSLQWAFDEHLCWIRQNDTLPCLWAPVGDWNAVNWANHPLLARGATLIRVPETLAHLLEQALPGRVTLIEARGHWEYLYDAEGLAKLAGKSYHKKKNHVNAYRREYGEPQYKEISPEIIEDVLALEDEWCQWHECEGSQSLRAENEAINRVLSRWSDMPGLTGGALYAGDVLVAFCVGEQLDATTIGVHYEKARNGYRGAYQMINQQFAQASAATARLLNRAQDLDEDGLRQAKMSYMPTDFLHKYTVRVSAAN